MIYCFRINFIFLFVFIGKARPIFSSFTAYERRSCLKTMCNAFKNRNDHEIVKTILVDKDLQEVDVLKVSLFYSILNF